MDIFKAVELLNRGEKIRDIKSPPGVFLEKRNGKIVSSQGREGIDLNTDAEYEIYKEKEPEFINKISILLEDLSQYTQERCSYDCKECKLHINNECIKDELHNIIKRKDMNEFNKNIITPMRNRFKTIYASGYNGETKVTDISDIGKIKPTFYTTKDLEEEKFKFVKASKAPEILEVTFLLNEGEEKEVMKKIVDQLTRDGFKMKGF